MRIVQALKELFFSKSLMPLLWRHNGLDSVSNHQPHDYLLKRLFMHRSKKTPKLRVTGLCAGNSPETGELGTPHIGPVTRKMFPFDDVIMFYFNALGAIYEWRPRMRKGFHPCRPFKAPGSYITIYDTMSSWGHWETRDSVCDPYKAR